MQNKFNNYFFNNNNKIRSQVVKKGFNDLIV